MNNFTPEILKTETLVDGHQVTLDLAHGLSVFEGHFPGDPILAGVVQIHWAIRVAENIFGTLGEFKGMEQVKFFSLIRSGGVLDLKISYEREKNKLDFEYTVSGERKSSGTLLLGG